MPREPRPIKTARPSASRTTPPRAAATAPSSTRWPRLILKVQVSNTDGFDDTAVLEFADYKLGGLVHEGTFDVKTGTAATAGSVVSDWMLRQCTGAPKTATDKCVATFDAATGVMTFTMILLPQTLANALVLEISPDDGEYQSYSNKDMIKPALEARLFLYLHHHGEEDGG